MKAAERYSMRDVAILTQLKCKETNQVITIVNTHVDFGEFRKPDLQILQVSHHGNIAVKKLPRVGTIHTCIVKWGKI